ncbi:MAG: hypothetical protein ACE148_09640 [Vicinamibacterales bacterium]
MSPRKHIYRPAVLEALAAHGIVPKETTPPQKVRDLLSDLYRYEIRRLRDRLLRGETPKSDYARQVMALRNGYPLLSLPLSLWVVGEAKATED